MTQEPFDRIYTQSSLPFDLIKKWKDQGEKIVFTNGCFDLLHRGHIQYLNEASSLGQRLILGLNSDASVKRIKGQGRPIMDQQNRSEILAALKMVDLVIIFEEDTPFNLIKNILPDILVKGGDWKIEQIIGSDVVINKGGEVKTLSFIEGESSTNILHSILKKYKK